MKKVKAHVSLFVREATAIVYLSDSGEVMSVEDIEDIGDFEDVEVKQIIYAIQ